MMARALWIVLVLLCAHQLMAEVLQLEDCSYYHRYVQGRIVLTTVSCLPRYSEPVLWSPPLSQFKMIAVQGRHPDHNDGAEFDYSSNPKDAPVIPEFDQNDGLLSDTGEGWWGSLHHGFQALHVSAPTRPMMFSRKRDGGCPESIPRDSRLSGSSVGHKLAYSRDRDCWYKNSYEFYVAYTPVDNAYYIKRMGIKSADPNNLLFIGDQIPYWMYEYQSGTKVGRVFTEHSNSMIATKFADLGNLNDRWHHCDDSDTCFQEDSGWNYNIDKGIFDRRPAVPTSSICPCGGFVYYTYKPDGSFVLNGNPEDFAIAIGDPPMAVVGCLLSNDCNSRGHVRFTVVFDTPRPITIAAPQLPTRFGAGPLTIQVQAAGGCAISDGCVFVRHINSLTDMIPFTAMSVKTNGQNITKNNQRDGYLVSSSNTTIYFDYPKIDYPHVGLPMPTLNPAARITANGGKSPSFAIDMGPTPLNTPIVIGVHWTAPNCTENTNCPFKVFVQKTAANPHGYLHVALEIRIHVQDALDGVPITGTTPNTTVTLEKEVPTEKSSNLNLLHWPYPGPGQWEAQLAAEVLTPLNNQFSVSFNFTTQQNVTMIEDLPNAYLYVCEHRGVGCSVSLAELTSNGWDPYIQKAGMQIRFRNWPTSGTPPVIPNLSVRNREVGGTDLTRCPVGWTPSELYGCNAGADYGGGCSTSSQFQGYTDAAKLDWASNCGVTWPSDPKPNSVPWVWKILCGDAPSLDSERCLIGKWSITIIASDDGDGQMHIEGFNITGTVDPAQNMIHGLEVTNNNRALQFSHIIVQRGRLIYYQLRQTALNGKKPTLVSFSGQIRTEAEGNIQGSHNKDTRWTDGQQQPKGGEVHFDDNSRSYLSLKGCNTYFGGALEGSYSEVAHTWPRNYIATRMLASSRGYEVEAVHFVVGTGCTTAQAWTAFFDRTSSTSSTSSIEVSTSSKGGPNSWISFTPPLPQLQIGVETGASGFAHWKERYTWADSTPSGWFSDRFVLRSTGSGPPPATTDINEDHFATESNMDTFPHVDTNGFHNANLGDRVDLMYNMTDPNFRFHGYGNTPSNRVVTCQSTCQGQGHANYHAGIRCVCWTTKNVAVEFRYQHAPETASSCSGNGFSFAKWPSTSSFALAQSPATCYQDCYEQDDRSPDRRCYCSGNSKCCSDGTTSCGVTCESVANYGFSPPSHTPSYTGVCGTQSPYKHIRLKITASHAGYTIGTHSSIASVQLPIQPRIQASAVFSSELLLLDDTHNASTTLTVNLNHVNTIGNQNLAVRFTIGDASNMTYVITPESAFNTTDSPKEFDILVPAGKSSANVTITAVTRPMGFEGDVLYLTMQPRHAIVYPAAGSETLKLMAMKNPNKPVIELRHHTTLTRCPVGWTPSELYRCNAGADYGGGCSTSSQFQGYTDAAKLDWASNCGVTWPYITINPENQTCNFDSHGCMVQIQRRDSDPMSRRDAVTVTITVNPAFVAAFPGTTASLSHTFPGGQTGDGPFINIPFNIGPNIYLQDTVNLPALYFNITTQSDVLYVRRGIEISMDLTSVPTNQGSALNPVKFCDEWVKTHVPGYRSVCSFTSLTALLSTSTFYSFVDVMAYTTETDFTNVVFAGTQDRTITTKATTTRTTTNLRGPIQYAGSATLTITNSTIHGATSFSSSNAQTTGTALDLASTGLMELVNTAVICKCADTTSGACPAPVTIKSGASLKLSGSSYLKARTVNGAPGNYETPPGDRSLILLDITTTDPAKTHLTTVANSIRNWRGLDSLIRLDGGSNIKIAVAHNTLEGYVDNNGDKPLGLYSTNAVGVSLDGITSAPQTSSGYKFYWSHLLFSQTVPTQVDIRPTNVATYIHTRMLYALSIGKPMVATTAVTLPSHLTWTLSGTFTLKQGEYTFDANFADETHNKVDMVLGDGAIINGGVDLRCASLSTEASVIVRDTITFKNAATVTVAGALTFLDNGKPPFKFEKASEIQLAPTAQITVQGASPRDRPSSDRVMFQLSKEGYGSGIGSGAKQFTNARVLRSLPNSFGMYSMPAGDWINVDRTNAYTQSVVGNDLETITTANGIVLPLSASLEHVIYSDTGTTIDANSGFYRNVSITQGVVFTVNSNQIVQLESPTFISCSVVINAGASLNITGHAVAQGVVTFTGSGTVKVDGELHLQSATFNGVSLSLVPGSTVFSTGSTALLTASPSFSCHAAQITAENFGSAQSVDLSGCTLINTGHQAVLTASGNNVTVVHSFLENRNSALVPFLKVSAAAHVAITNNTFQRQHSAGGTANAIGLEILATPTIKLTITHNLFGFNSPVDGAYIYLHSSQSESASADLEVHGNVKECSGSPCGASIGINTVALHSSYMDRILAFARQQVTAIDECRPVTLRALSVLNPMLRGRISDVQGSGSPNVCNAGCWCAGPTIKIEPVSSSPCTENSECSFKLTVIPTDSNPDAYLNTTLDIKITVPTAVSGVQLVGVSAPKTIQIPVGMASSVTESYTLFHVPFGSDWNLTFTPQLMTQNLRFGVNFTTTPALMRDIPPLNRVLKVCPSLGTQCSIEASQLSASIIQNANTNGIVLTNWPDAPNATIDLPDLNTPQFLERITCGSDTCVVRKWRISIERGGGNTFHFRKITQSSDPTSLIDITFDGAYFHLGDISVQGGVFNVTMAQPQHTGADKWTSLYLENNITTSTTGNIQAYFLQKNYFVADDHAYGGLVIPDNAVFDLHGCHTFFQGYLTGAYHIIYIPNNPFPDSYIALYKGSEPTQGYHHIIGDASCNPWGWLPGILAQGYTKFATTKLRGPGNWADVYTLPQLDLSVLVGNGNATVPWKERNTWSDSTASGWFVDRFSLKILNSAPPMPTIPAGNFISSSTIEPFIPLNLTAFTTQAMGYDTLVVLNFNVTDFYSSERNDVCKNMCEGIGRYHHSAGIQCSCWTPAEAIVEYHYQHTQNVSRKCTDVPGFSLFSGKCVQNCVGGGASALDGRCFCGPNNACQPGISCVSTGFGREAGNTNANNMNGYCGELSPYRNVILEIVPDPSRYSVSNRFATLQLPLQPDYPITASISSEFLNLDSGNATAVLSVSITPYDNNSPATNQLGEDLAVTFHITGNLTEFFITPDSARNASAAQFDVLIKAGEASGSVNLTAITTSLFGKHEVLNIAMQPRHGIITPTGTTQFEIVARKNPQRPVLNIQPPPSCVFKGPCTMTVSRTDPDPMSRSEGAQATLTLSAEFADAFLIANRTREVSLPAGAIVNVTWQVPENLFVDSNMHQAIPPFVVNMTTSSDVLFERHRAESTMSVGSITQPAGDSLSPIRLCDSSVMSSIAHFRTLCTHVTISLLEAPHYYREIHIMSYGGARPVQIGDITWGGAQPRTIKVVPHEGQSSMLQGPLKYSGSSTLTVVDSNVTGTSTGHSVVVSGGTLKLNNTAVTCMCQSTPCPAMALIRDTGSLHILENAHLVASTATYGNATYGGAVFEISPNGGNADRTMLWLAPGAVRNWMNHDVLIRMDNTNSIKAVLDHRSLEPSSSHAFTIAAFSTQAGQSGTIDGLSVGPNAHTKMGRSYYYSHGLFTDAPPAEIQVSSGPQISRFLYALAYNLPVSASAATTSVPAFSPWAPGAPALTLRGSTVWNFAQGASVPMPVTVDASGPVSVAGDITLSGSPLRLRGAGPVSIADTLTLAQVCHVLVEAPLTTASANKPTFAFTQANSSLSAAAPVSRGQGSIAELATLPATAYPSFTISGAQNLTSLGTEAPLYTVSAFASLEPEFKRNAFSRQVAQKAIFTNTTQSGSVYLSLVPPAVTVHVQTPAQCAESTPCNYIVRVISTEDNPDAYLDDDLVLTITPPTLIRGIALEGDSSPQQIILQKGDASSNSSAFALFEAAYGSNWTLVPTVTVEDVSFDVRVVISTNTTMIDQLPSDGVLKVCPAAAPACNVLVPQLQANGWAPYIAPAVSKIELRNWASIATDLPELTITSAVTDIYCADSNCVIHKWNITVPSSQDGAGILKLERITQSNASTSLIDIEYANGELRFKDVKILGGVLRFNMTRTRLTNDGHGWARVYFDSGATTSPSGNFHGYFSQNLWQKDGYDIGGWVHMDRINGSHSHLNFQGCDTWFRGRLAGLYYSRNEPVPASYIATRKPDAKTEGFHHMIGTGCSNAHAWGWLPQAVLSEGYTEFVPHQYFGGHANSKEGRWIPAFKLPELELGVRAGSALTQWKTMYTVADSSATSWFRDTLILKPTNEAPPPPAIPAHNFTVSSTIEPFIPLDLSAFTSPSALGRDTLVVLNFATADFHSENRTGICTGMCSNIGRTHSYPGIQCSCWNATQAVIEYNYQHAQNASRKCDDVQGFSANNNGICVQECASLAHSRSLDGRCYCGGSMGCKHSQLCVVDGFEREATNPLTPAGMVGYCGERSPYRHVTLELKQNTDRYSIANAKRFATLQLPLQPSYYVSASLSKNFLDLEDANVTAVLRVSIADHSGTAVTNQLGEDLAVTFSITGGNLTDFWFTPASARNASSTQFDVVIKTGQTSASINISAMASDVFHKHEFLDISMQPRRGIIVPEGVTSFKITAKQDPPDVRIRVQAASDCVENAPCAYTVSVVSTEANPEAYLHDALTVAVSFPTSLGGIDLVGDSSPQYITLKEGLASTNSSSLTLFQAAYSSNWTLSLSASASTAGLTYAVQYESAAVNMIDTLPNNTLKVCASADTHCSVTLSQLNAAVGWGPFLRDATRIELLWNQAPHAIPTLAGATAIQEIYSTSGSRIEAFTLAGGAPALTVRGVVFAGASSISHSGQRLVLNNVGIQNTTLAVAMNRTSGSSGVVFQTTNALTMSGGGNLQVTFAQAAGVASFEMGPVSGVGCDSWLKGTNMDTAARSINVPADLVVLRKPTATTQAWAQFVFEGCDSRWAWLAAARAAGYQSYARDRKLNSWRSTEPEKPALHLGIQTPTGVVPDYVYTTSQWPFSNWDSRTFRLNVSNGAPPPLPSALSGKFVFNNTLQDNVVPLDVPFGSYDLGHASVRVLHLSPAQLYSNEPEAMCQSLCTTHNRSASHLTIQCHCWNPASQINRYTFTHQNTPAPCGNGYTMVGAVCLGTCVLSQPKNFENQCPCQQDAHCPGQTCESGWCSGTPYRTITLRLTESDAYTIQNARARIRLPLQPSYVVTLTASSQHLVADTANATTTITASVSPAATGRGDGLSLRFGLAGNMTHYFLSPDTRNTTSELELIVPRGSTNTNMELTALNTTAFGKQEQLTLTHIAQPFQTAPPPLTITLEKPEDLFQYVNASAPASCVFDSPCVLTLTRYARVKIVPISVIVTVANGALYNISTEPRTVVFNTSTSTATLTVIPRNGLIQNATNLPAFTFSMTLDGPGRLEHTALSVSLNAVTIRVEAPTQCDENAACAYSVRVVPTANNPSAALAQTVEVRITTPAAINGIALIGDAQPQTVTLAAGTASSSGGSFTLYQAAYGSNWQLTLTPSLVSTNLSFSVLFDSPATVTMRDIQPLNGVLKVCPSLGTQCNIAASQLSASIIQNANTNWIVLTNWPNAPNATIDLPDLSVPNFVQRITCGSDTCTVRKWRIITGRAGGGFVFERITQSSDPTSLIDITFNGAYLHLGDIIVQGGVFNVTMAQPQHTGADKWTSLYLERQITTSTTGNIHAHFLQKNYFVAGDHAYGGLVIPNNAVFDLHGCHTFFQGYLTGAYHIIYIPDLNNPFPDSYIALHKGSDPTQGYHHIIGDASCNPWGWLPGILAQGYTKFATTKLRGPGNWNDVYKMPELDLKVRVGTSLTSWYGRTSWADSQASGWYSSIIDLRISNGGIPPEPSALAAEFFNTSSNLQTFVPINASRFSEPSALGYDTLKVLNFNTSSFYASNRGEVCQNMCGAIDKTKYYPGLQCHCWGGSSEAAIEHRYQHAARGSYTCRDVYGFDYDASADVCFQECSSANQTRAPDGRCFCGAGAGCSGNLECKTSEFREALNAPSWANGICGTESPYRQITLRLLPNPGAYSISNALATLQLPRKPDYAISASISSQLLNLDAGNATATLQVQIANYVYKQGQLSVAATNKLGEDLAVRFRMSGSLSGFEFTPASAFNASGSQFDVVIPSGASTGSVAITALTQAFGKSETLHVEMLPRLGIVKPSGSSSFTITAVKTPQKPVVNIQPLASTCSYGAQCGVNISRTDTDPMSLNQSVVVSAVLSPEFTAAFLVQPQIQNISLPAGTFKTLLWNIPHSIFVEDSPAVPIFSVSITASTDVLFEHQIAQSVMANVTLPPSVGSSANPVKYCDASVVSILPHFRTLCTHITVASMLSTPLFYSYIDFMSYGSNTHANLGDVVWGGSQPRTIRTVPYGSSRVKFGGPIRYAGNSTLTISNSEVTGAQTASGAAGVRVEQGDVIALNTSLTCACQPNQCTALISILNNGAFVTSGSSHLTASSVYTSRSIFEIVPNTVDQSRVFLKLTPSSVHNWAPQDALLSLSNANNIKVTIDHQTLKPPLNKPLATYSAAQGQSASLAGFAPTLGQVFNGRRFYWTHALLSASPPASVDISGSYPRMKMLYALSTHTPMRASSPAAVPQNGGWEFAGTFQFQSGVFYFSNFSATSLPVSIGGSATIMGPVPATGAVSLNGTVQLNNVSFSGASVTVLPTSSVTATGDAASLLDNAPLFQCNHAQIEGARFGSAQSVAIDSCVVSRTAGDNESPVLRCTGESLVVENSHMQDGGSFAVPFLEYNNSKVVRITNNTFHHSSGGQTIVPGSSIGLNIGLSKTTNMTVAHNVFSRSAGVASSTGGAHGNIALFSVDERPPSNQSALIMHSNAIHESCSSSIVASRQNGTAQPNCTSLFGVFFNNVHPTYLLEFQTYAVGKNVTLGTCANAGARAVSLLNPDLRGTAYDVFYSTNGTNATCSDGCPCPPPTSLPPTTAAPTTPAPTTTSEPGGSTTPPPATTTAQADAPSNLVQNNVTEAETSEREQEDESEPESEEEDQTTFYLLAAGLPSVVGVGAIIGGVILYMNSQAAAASAAAAGIGSRPKLTETSALLTRLTVES